MVRFIKNLFTKEEPEYVPADDVKEYYETKEWFNASYQDRMDHFFGSIPNVITWNGTSCENVNVILKGRKGFYTARGYFELDDGGEILRWKSYIGEISLERENLTISEEMLAEQIKGLLTDDERASKYCEQVSMSLLEDGSCVFNAPYGLRLKEKEYEARYHSKEWETAWINALTEEFQTKEVCKDETAGVGCFRLQAI